MDTQTVTPKEQIDTLVDSLIGGTSTNFQPCEPKSQIPGPSMATALLDAGVVTLVCNSQ